MIVATRKKTTPDILDWQELEQAPNVRGAFSFLTSTAQVVSIARGQEPQTPHEPRNTTSTVDVVSTVDDTTTVDKTSTVDVSQSVKCSERKRRIYPCTLAQDGQSHGETALYDALWRLGAGDTAEYRDVTAGWDVMARAARMSDKAAKRNLTSLIAKRSIDLIAPEDSSIRRGRTYRVYSYEVTLERRKAAGLIYVVRDKGVHFVNAAGERIDPGGTVSQGQNGKTSTVDVSSTVDKTSSETVDGTSPDTVDVSSPLISNYLERVLVNSSSTSDEDQVLAAMAQYTVADRQAARQMLQRCRSACADVAVDEIAAIIHAKAAVMKAQRKITNPVGFLLTAVPLCCDPASMREFRAQRRLTEEAERARSAVDRARERDNLEFFRKEYERYRAMVDDPSSQPEQVARARKAMDELEAIVSDMEGALKSQGVAPSEAVTQR